MKTNNLMKKSFLTTMILALSAGFNTLTKRGNGAALAAGHNETGLHSHGTFHKHGKFKGWMRENRRYRTHK